MMTTYRDKSGKALGYIERYVSTEPGRGRWAHRWTERVYWRAIPFSVGRPDSFHSRRKDAIAALEGAESG